MTFSIGFSGTEVIFTGDASNDSLTLSVSNEGLLVHDVDLGGNLVSPADMNSDQPGEQSITIDALTMVRVDGAGGDDSLDASLVSKPVVLFGSAGSDILRGGSGNDDLRGGDGNDILEGNDGNDVLDSDYWSSFGDDVLNGGNGNDSLHGGQYDQLYGGDGTDSATTNALTNVVLTDSSYTTSSVVSLDHGVEIWVLHGTEFDDVLDASGWNGGTLVLYGHAGNDLLRGGIWDDDLRGGDGDDILEGNGGNDSLDWRDYMESLGIDTLRGGDGNDELRGGEFDQLYGGNGDDIAGTDALTSVILTDSTYTTSSILSINHQIERWRLNGTAGNDSLDASAWTGTGIPINGFAGDDILRGGAGNDDLRGGDGNDILEGNGGNDALDSDYWNSFGNDVLRGGDGNDTLRGGQYDQLYGGNGTDSVTTEALTSVVLTDSSYTTSTIVSLDHGVEIWVLHGSEFDDLLDASAWNGGSLTIYGHAGNDILRGGIWDDDLRGGDGNDVLEGNGGNDSLDWRDYWESIGDDVLRGGDGDDELRGGEFDQFYGGPGDDVATTDALSNAQLTDDTFTTSSIVSLNHQIESWRLNGTNGNDDLDASAWTGLGVRFNGLAGNDTLLGGLGNDEIRGGDGQDIIVGGAGVDSLFGGTGDDQLTGTYLSLFSPDEGSNTALVYASDGDDFITVSYDLLYINARQFRYEAYSHIAIQALAGSDRIDYLGTPKIDVAIGSDTPIPLIPGDVIAPTGAFDVQGSILDPNESEAWSASVDYGDGVGPQPLSLSANGSFSLSRTYVRPGTYRVLVTVRDSTDRIGTRAFNVQWDAAPLGEWLSGSVFSLGARQEWRFVANAGQLYDFVVNPNSAGANRPQIPVLTHGRLEILDANGSKLYESQTRNANGDLALRAIELPASGLYRLVVTASSNVPHATGEYILAAFNSTPVERPIEFSQRYTGTLNPYASPDHLVFNTVADRQIQVNISTQSTSGISYRLQGPNGWVGPTIVAGISDPIVVPYTGKYRLLTINDGAARAAYSLMITETNVQTIQLGEIVEGSLPESRTSQLYRFEVSEPTPILARLSDLNALNDNELYLRRGAPPTRSQYDARFVSPLSAEQSIIVSRAAAGEWYALVFADRLDSSSSYLFQVAPAPLLIDSVSPQSAAINQRTTVTVRGVGFVSGATVSLVASNGQVHPAQLTEVDSFEQLTAFFEPNTLPAGDFTVRVTTPGGAPVQQADAIRFVENAPTDFRTKIIAPDTLGWHGTAQIIVEYTNAGNAPIPAPLVDFTAEVDLGGSEPNPQNGIFTLDPSRVTQGFWTAAYPEGFSRSIQFLASGETPGVLMPGETNQVTIYYVGWQQPWYHGKPFKLNATPTYADNPTPLDWSQYKDSMKPESVPDDAWDVIFENFTVDVGSTWGSYIATLGENAIYLSRLGRKVNDVESIYSFIVQQAIGIYSPPVIGRATDLYIVSSGIDINISRSFQVDLIGRNTYGDFGLGWNWEGPWDMRLRMQADGSVSIGAQGRAARLFQPDSRIGRGYVAMPGDYGLLGVADSSGHLKLQEKDGTTIEFLPSGLVESVYDLNGNRISAYYQNDKLQRLDHSSGGFVEVVHDLHGNISRLYGSSGDAVDYIYSSDGKQLLQVLHSNGQTQHYSYGSEGVISVKNAITEIISASGVKQVFGYDQNGRLASTSKADGSERVNFVYEKGSVSEVRSPSEAMSHSNLTRMYDQNLRLSRLIESTGYSLTFDYDDRGDLSRVIDSEGRSSYAIYDKRGNMIRAVNALGAESAFSYTESLDRVASFVDANGNVTSYEYDSRGNLVREVNAHGQAKQWSYDSVGNVSQYVNARGQVVDVQSDQNGNTIRTNWLGGEHLYFYDARSNLTGLLDSSGYTTYEIDPITNLLERVTNSHGRSIAFEYCTCGRRESMTDSTGYSVFYSYTENGRLESVSDIDMTTLVAYTYDANGLLLEEAFGNGVRTRYSYDPSGRILSSRVVDGTGEEILEIDYLRDLRGLPVEMRVDGRVWNYRYDDIGQVVSWNGPDNQSEEYEYDRVGNRTAIRLANGDLSFNTYNALNQLIQAGTTGVSLVYDADGGLISKGDGEYFEYDVFGRLVRGVSSGVETQYAYNGVGQLVSSTKDGNTQDYLVDPAGLWNIVAAFEEDLLIERKVFGDGLVSTMSDRGLEYFLFDASGSAVAILDGLGNVKGRLGYSPFGEIVESNGFQGAVSYHGKYGVTQESGDLFFMRARFYDATGGRFISPDPIGINGGFNLYRFAANNPIVLSDPSGLEPHGFNPDNRWGGGAGLFEEWQRWRDRDRLYCIVGEEYRISKGGCRVIPDPCGRGGDFGPQRNPCTPPPPPPAPAPPSPPSPDPRIRNGLRYPPPQGGPADPGGTGSDAATIFSDDPNEKTGPSGYGEERFVVAESVLNYRIDFENDLSATAPAQMVEIYDTLSPDFDLSSLELTSVGWGDVFIAIPSGRNFYRTTVPMEYLGVSFLVDVEIGILPGTRLLYAQFLSLDQLGELPPAPTIGFLPPEDESGRGMGFFTYNIRPRAGLASGTRIENIAQITFDRGVTIATDQVDPHDPSQGLDPTRRAHITIDAVAPVSSVQPLAVTSDGRFLVSWSGTDDENGSGVVAYDIYVSENGSLPEIWQPQTSSTHAIFAGRAGHSYAFYSIAIDGAGLREAAPTGADAVTTVEAVPPQVSLAIASSSSWQSGFIDVIDGLGSGAGNGIGVALSDGIAPLAQGNVDRLFVRFTEDVVGISNTTLELRDSNGIIPIVVSYDASTFSAMIAFSSSLALGKYRLSVADEVTDLGGTPLDGDSSGDSGGIFSIRFDILPGDANGDGRVNGADLPTFGSAFNSQAGGASYNPRVDWNGDGRVNGLDLPIFAANFNRQLANLQEPGAPFSGGGGTSSRYRLVDSFFGWIGSNEEIDSDSDPLTKKRTVRPRMRSSLLWTEK